ncbi:MAG TPA: exopolysaccharide biosynthesis polyprenyl glycosylphosphotransferase [Solirubrobacterales bacterium]|jgi:exopolysaccharide biosynthesis polyprenyl glycosylphosphotransferase|nr:exopolysaccharide biosynthesis polyprenyl glycosylphosphotransferase [Solirubrobacterales bacterium]
MRGKGNSRGQQGPVRFGLTWTRAMVIGVVTGVAAYAMAAGADARLGLALAVGLVFVWVHRSVARHVAPHARFLPLMRLVVPIAGPGWAFVILGSLHLLGLLSLALPSIAILCVLGALCAILVVKVPGEPRRPPRRVAVVGSAGTTADLRAELTAQADSSVAVVGHIGLDRSENIGPGARGTEEPIGVLGELAQTVVNHRLDLLLVSSTVPRMSFFNEMEATCSHLEVRVLELSSFYEHTFGHVPLRAINAAWFQWVMHPRYSPRTPTSKRAVDLAIASLVALVAVPIVAVFALFVKLSGGPAFYRQTRIGEGGEPFQIIKLRSMRVAPPGLPARWSAADDERVTRLGRVLRRTHFDELPQLLNVLKGEMSIVGPRPEQPGFVEALEESVPFYSRRHVARPGITGWAQVGCGYAGSHEGTLWKLSHDLYYLKHRSLTFDLLILGETARMVFTRSHFPNELDLLPFVHHLDDPQPPGPRAVTSGSAD